jgi:hypothetical protein
MSLQIETKDFNMKKIIATGAILSLLSAPVFAQEAATTAAGQTGTAATGTAATGTAAGTTGGFFGTTAVAGLSTGTLVAIGVAVAAVAVAASDSDSTTNHSTTTHH